MFTINLELYSVDFIEIGMESSCVNTVDGFKMKTMFSCCFHSNYTFRLIN